MSRFLSQSWSLLLEIALKFETGFLYLHVNLNKFLRKNTECLKYASTNSTLVFDTIIMVKPRVLLKAFKRKRLSQILSVTAFM